jgi:hypothetical protein
VEVLEFFSNVKEESLLPFGIKRVLHTKDGIIGRYDIHPETNTGYYFVRQNAADRVVGIVVYIPEIGVSLQEYGEGNVTELPYGQIV